jgi:hypothetical protein
MTPDPGHIGARIGDPQTWNAYAYAGNDPVNHVDPTGLVYEICAQGFSCFEVEDADYAFWTNLTKREHGIDLPQNVFGKEFVDCGDGGNCLSVEYFDKTRTAIEFFGAWFDGNMPQRIFYGPDDPKTDEMGRTATFRSQREQYVANGCPAESSIPSGHFAGPWFESAQGLWIGPWMPTQVQVGGYDLTISRTTRNSVTYRITNTVGISSLVGLTAIGNKIGLSDATRHSLDKNSGRSHNIVQVFEWSETNPCLWRR